MPKFDVERATRESYPRLHRAALVLTGNPWDADDLVQETFLEATRSAARFAGRSTGYTWLYAILLNRVRRWHRRRAWFRRLGEIFERRPHASNGEPADRGIEAREWRESLWAQVAQLSPPQRDVLVLRYSEGLTQDEIAGVLDCPVGTVKSRLHHALVALRARVGGTPEDWFVGVGQVPNNGATSSRNESD